METRLSSNSVAEILFLAEILSTIPLLISDYKPILQQQQHSKASLLSTCAWPECDVYSKSGSGLGSGFLIGMSEDLPFRAEYAKSGRASCKACKISISKDSLRLAKMVQSQHFDGKQPHWFHYSCFFGKAKPKVLSDIAGVDALRWDDQEKIRNYFGGCTSAANKPSNDATDGEAKDFQVEYAKSGRSKCKECENKIEKNQLRVAIMVEGDKKFISQKIPSWHHVPCFVKVKKSSNEMENLSENDLEGFSSLQDADKTLLKEQLGLKKKSKASKKTSKLERTKSQIDNLTLKDQNEKLWKLRDNMQKNFSICVLREILETNGMDSKGGENDLLDRCADAMMFGVPGQCPECNSGKLQYSASHGYRCSGHLTAWTKCLYSTKDPKRALWEITDEQKEEHDFLKSFKPEIKQRIFPKSSNETDPEKPLKNKKILLSGKPSQSKEDLTLKIEKLGGVLMKTVSSDLFCCISTAADVGKKTKKNQQLQDKGVPIVSEEFLDEIKHDNLQEKISAFELVPTKPKDSVDSGAPKRKLPSTELLSPKKAKLMIKGGAVVDPESELEFEAHVYQKDVDIYSAVLGMVDLNRGTNSYYKLQLLEHDRSKKYFIFRSWGRVGTTIGGNKLEEFYTLEEAIDNFTSLFEEKTGNNWYKRKDFVKHPYKFYPLEMDYGQDDEKLLKMQNMSGSSSKLSVPVQDLIKLIFDVESMKKTMAEFEIDLNKMPLGKLSKKQIQKAYNILGELQKYIDDKESKTKILDASNRFYTLIPHDFGMKVPPLLDRTAMIKAKTEMLENLLDIEVAYSLLQSSSDSNENPIDVHYKSLQADIKTLDRDLDEFKRIEDYVKNTHAATHRQYSLDILEVFTVERNGEGSRYGPFKELHNRKLLWHGSRRSNYAGIISQGLRIAPPEAPVTGYMFGKGIYFADMVSKSANYCRTTPTDNIGLLLICEVALGNMYELTNASPITKLPKGKHSCKGCGRTGPNPSKDFALPDGTVIPLGEGMDTSTKKSSLLYNEYIVYDVAQVNMKYLLKVNFNYK